MARSVAEQARLNRRAREVLADAGVLQAVVANIRSGGTTIDKLLADISEVETQAELRKALEELLTVDS